MDHCPYEAYHAEKPAYRVLWGHAGNYHCAHGRVAYREQDILCPEGVDGDVRVRQVQNQKQEAKGCQRQGERPQRPGQPSAGAAVHTIDTSTLLSYPFCHNHTLQDDRLPDVMRRRSKRIFARTTNHEDMRGHRGCGGGDLSILTSFSIDGEYRSNTF